MRLLANDNIPAAAIDALRTQGHEVAWIREIDPGARDEEVLARATAEQWILITFDKDFGELVFRGGRKAVPGVILFRFTRSSASRVAKAAVEALASRLEWIGHFATVDDGQIRMTPLPPPEV